ncbi:MAG TPA: hypothetical protein VN517_15575, partial [Terriglobales bacterium]|nr:hypothetical protein [Terriglobales bacterium]
CAVPLRLLRDGRLYQFEVRPQTPSEPVTSTQPSRSLSHFWLCGECSSKLTLVFDQLKAVVVKPNIAA